MNPLHLDLFLYLLFGPFEWFYRGPAAQAVGRMFGAALGNAARDLREIATEGAALLVMVVLFSGGICCGMVVVAMVALVVQVRRGGDE